MSRNVPVMLGLALTVLVTLTTPAIALPTATVERVSVDSNGAQGNDLSYRYSDITDDGRFAAYASSATNLVAGDTNGFRDIFIRDRALSVTERVSVHSDTSQGDGDSFEPSVSADGRYVTFRSSATNLVDSDTNASSDAFVHDRQNGTTERVSVDSNGTEGDNNTYTPRITPDGRYVVFHSDASNLVIGDANSFTDVFIHDRQTGVTEIVSSDADGANDSSALGSASDDGRFVAFASSASDLVPGDTNGAQDIFVRDRQMGTTTLVSVHTNATQGNNHSFGSPRGGISGDGRYVVFPSWATNLVDGDTNVVEDVFVRDLQEGTTERVSVHSNGTEGDDSSNGPAISADGRYVVFESNSTNLVDDQLNSGLFLRDRVTSETQLVSVSALGVPGRGSDAAISFDGHFVVYSSFSADLVEGDTNLVNDMFVWFGNTPPITTDVFVSVASDATVGTTIGSVGGTDADGDSVTFSIATGNVGGAFGIDAVSGQITVASALDFANNSSYVLGVEVTDGYATEMAIVTVTPIFEVPTTPRFVDVPADHLFYTDVEWLAWRGITKGCNPPLNDQYCPNDPVTRGQMAAFLVRALGLTDDGGGNKFVDDDGSVFESDIAKLAAAGITKGCNPPLNDQYCPNDPVTRGQMAAFLVRAVGYTDIGLGDLFDDDDASVFETDIDKIGTAGVTKGCNPPDNNLYCPTNNVSRAQMAAFLHRALG